jgi:hypothetical protein
MALLLVASLDTMGDSQNWSSFDAEVPKPKKPSPPKSDGSALGLKPVDLRNLRNRLVFGGLVGFCTGATFGTSASLAICCVRIDTPHRLTVPTSLTAVDSIRAYQKTHPRLALAALNPVARGAAVSGSAFAGYLPLASHGGSKLCSLDG